MMIRIGKAGKVCWRVKIGVEEVGGFSGFPGVIFVRLWLLNMRSSIR